MDTSEFDRLTKLVATAATRRAIGKTMLAGSVAALITRLGAGNSSDAVVAAPAGDLADAGRRRGRGRGRGRGRRRRPRRRQRRCPASRRCDGGHCCGADKVCAAGECVSGRGTCPAGADSCRGQITNCNDQDDCFCFRSAEGTTRCGFEEHASTCGECTESARCATLYPDTPGVFCAIDTAGPAGNCFCEAGQGACVLPCPPPQAQSEIR